MTTKEAVLELIERMPEDASLVDIMEELYIRRKIDVGISQLDAGETVEHEDVKRRLAQWLS